MTNAAIYARVSSTSQAQANTIGSQIEALKSRVKEDGLELWKEMEFVDDGYSGISLVRPGLERLRDQASAGVVDRVYVHSPDRLARKYVYQMLLVEEFRQSGVEVIFLNHKLGGTPEDDLLLQVQGMIAEYERTKIIERNRRGKKHAARAGSVSVLSCAPYGYRYVSKQAGGGEARFEIDIDESRVVKQVFEWVSKERISLREVCRRLVKTGEKTRKGKIFWHQSVIRDMLKNPAYIGEAGFGKTKCGPKRTQLRPPRGCPAQAKRGYSDYSVSRDEWITISVPPLVERQVFEAAQDQLSENQLRSRKRPEERRYLLQGLIECSHCGYALSGRSIGKHSRYTYYRCHGNEPHRCGGYKLCNNRQVRTELLDNAVWQEVRKVLEHPSRMKDEYRSRLSPETETNYGEIVSVETRLKKLRNGLDRLIDSYANGLIDKSEFEPRITEIRERITRLEPQHQELKDQASMEKDLRLIINTLDQFSLRVKGRLDQADWSTKQELIRALVKRVEVDHDQVNVVFRVDPLPFDSAPDKAIWPHCRGRLNPPSQPENV